MPYEPETPISPIIRDAFFDALNPKSSTALAVKEDGSVAIKANQPPPEAKPKAAAGVTKPAPTPGAQPPAAAGPTPETQALTPFAGFGPVLAALSGPQAGGVSAATLTGLTPEQITGLLGAEAQKQKLRQGTIGQLLRMPYMQALTAKALRPGEEPVPLDVRTKAMEALTTQRLREPAGPRAEKLEERMYQEPDGTYWWGLFEPDATTPSRPKLRKATKRDLEFKEIVTGDLAERKFAYSKAKEAGRVRDLILEAPGDNRNEGLIPTANEGSQEPTLFLWTKSWTGDNAKVVRLPDGMVADNFPADLVTRLGEGNTVRMRNPKTKKVMKFKVVGKDVVVVK